MKISLPPTKTPNPNWLLFLTAVVLLTPLLMQITGNNLSKVAEDISYLAVFIYAINWIFRDKAMTTQIKPFFAFCVVLIGFYFILGFFYNGMVMQMLQFRELRYLLLFFIMLPFKNNLDLTKLWQVIKMIGYVSIPVSIGQYFYYKQFAAVSPVWADDVAGLYGIKGSGLLTMFMLIIFFVELGKRLLDNDRILGFYFLCLIPTALNETKITIFLVPLMLFFTLIVTKKMTFKRVFASLACIAVIGSIWISMYQSEFGESVDTVFSVKYLDNYFFSTQWEEDAGRFAKLEFAYNLIVDTNPLFGYGFGASYRGTSSGVEGKLYHEHFVKNMFEGTRPQIFVSFAENGFVGAAVWVVILLILFIKLMRRKKADLNKLIGVQVFLIVLASLTYQQIFYFEQVMFVLIIFIVTNFIYEPENLANPVRNEVV